MGCSSCKDKISGICKVCELLDGDRKIKIVQFCSFCGVYICNECNKDYLRRFQAYLKKLTEK